MSSVDENILSQKKDITAQEASELLRISLSTLHHLTRSGRIRGAKIGREWRYLAEDIEILLRDCLYHDSLADRRQETEHRTFRRINCFIQGRATVPLFWEKEGEWEGTVLNLGEGGALFEVYTLTHIFQAKQGDAVELALVLPGNDTREMRLKGVISHIDRQEGKTRFGITFQGMDSLMREAIHEFVVHFS